MKSPKSPIDRRPFRSKAEHQNEQSLEANYGRLAIPELIAALQLMPTAAAEQPAVKG